MTFDGRYYDQIFGPDFFGKLADLMGFAPTQEALSALRQGHYRAYSAFMDGHWELTQFQNLKAENARLDRVAKDAEKLFQSLVALYEFGQAQTKLKSEIENNPTRVVGPNGQTLASLLDQNRPDNPLFTFREFISDLMISAKRAQISKPKSIPMPTFDNDGDIDLDALGAWVLEKDFTSAGDQTADLIRWKERSAAHKLPKDHAILEFVRVFKTVWEVLSPHPFTQGHYYEKIGHDPSYTVTALKWCFAVHAPEVTGQRIVTAIRKVQATRE